MGTAEQLGTLFPTFVMNLDTVAVESLAAALEPIRLEAGQVLVSRGETDASLHVLVEGGLEVLAGEGVRLGTRGPGTWSGAIGLLEPGPSPVTLRAAEATSLLELTPAGVHTLREGPTVLSHLWAALARDLAVRLRECERIQEHGARRKCDATREALAALHGIPHKGELLAWVPSRRTRPGPADPAVTEQGRARLRSHLETVDSLASLDEPLRALLLRSATFERYEAGATLVEEDDERDGLFLVLDGQVQVAKAGYDALLGDARRLGPGELVGEIAFVDGGSRSATCKATMPTTVAVWYPLLIEELLRLGADGEVTAFHFLQWLSVQLARNARRMSDLLTQAATA